MARDPGGRSNAHTLDAQARALVEFPPSAATAAVRCPRVRADRSPADRAAVPPASAPLRRTRAVAHDVEAQVSTGVTPALGAGHPVDRVHRSSVPGENPRFSPKISEVKATDQQRPAQAPRNAHTLDAQARDLWSHSLRAQRRPLYAVPVCVLTVPPQTVQRYRQRRPHFVGNEPWPTMLRPSLPRVSHPRLAQAIPSIACFTQVYLGGTRGFRPRSRR